MSKIKIEYKSINELIPYINNPRDNSNTVDKVASSIKNFGFKVPIVIDKDNEIVTGHTRLLASKKLGLKEVPCIIADDLSEAQIKAFRIADNKVSEFSDWDFELLDNELEELKDMDLDFNMEDFGFSNSEKDDLEDEYVDINDENLDLDSHSENKMSFGKTKIIITDEELEMLENKYDEYIEINRVSYGFIRWLLDEH